MSHPMHPLEQQLSHGWRLHQQRQLAEAEHIYRHVLSQVPHSPNAWCYLGIALHDQRQYAAATQAYRQALQYQPQFPVALNNLGNSLRYLGAVEEADRCFQQAIELKPDYVNAYKNRGTLHVWSGNLQLGHDYYQQALRLNPHDAELHRNLGVIYLLQGRFDEGWREYRWRWQVGDLQRPSVDAPVWDGSDPRGKTLLLAAEQGLGDTLHFVRLAAWLTARGARVIVYCQAPLVGLLQQAPGLGMIYPNSLPVPQPVDFHCSLLDVADRLGLRADNLPPQVPYLAAAPQLLSYWAAALPARTERLRVGIAWQGNPDHQADAFRSIPLAEFETLAEVEGVEWLSLQQGFGSEQVVKWRGARPLTALEANVDQSSGAFMDTAAIVQQLDLVITSDTAIAHLAGALGVPTWIALNYVPDWRWMLDRDDSPWYPTVRLFRQSRMGDWGGVFAQIKSALQERSDA